MTEAVVVKAQLVLICSVIALRCELLLGNDWWVSVLDISAAASATISMQVRRHCIIIWKQRHMSTTARTVRKCSRVSAICADTYQRMALSVSRLLLMFLNLVTNR